jgi:hypothetical protein
MKHGARNFLLALIVLVLVVGIYEFLKPEPQQQSLPAGATPVGGMTIGASGLPALNAELATAGVKRIKLIGGAGQMVIAPSGDDELHVSLELRQQQRSLLWLFHWLSGDTARDLSGATLQQARQGDSLVLALVYPSHRERSDLQERWSVKLPARLMVDAVMYAGELKITGLQGGVSSQLTAGETVIEGVTGPVRASVTYGRLHVISDSARPGVLTLGSEHGLAVMSLDGKYYGPPERHGFFNDIHLFGNILTERRGGSDDMDLSVRYGEVDLRVGPLGDVHDYRDLFTAED